MKKIYAIVGSFEMKPGAQKGIHVFKYDQEQAVFSVVGDFRPEINAGQSAYEPLHDVIYVTNESHDEEGGQVYAWKLDPMTGRPIWLNSLATCSNLPSYICPASGGKYLLVPHHGPGQLVAKTVADADGNYRLQHESDDGTVVLIRLKENGSLETVCDVSWHDILRENGKIMKIPHLHSCVQAPGRNLFLVCDKGLDQIHSYRIDEDKEKLQLLSNASCEDGNHPRYLVFHPTLPLCYQNNEASAFINVWQYQEETGNLTRLQRIGLLKTEEESAELHIRIREN